jgi:hypothetical protein
MTNINLLHVSAPGCCPQGIFQITGIQAQHANLGMHRPHWNDYKIKILKYMKPGKHKITILLYKD